MITKNSTVPRKTFTVLHTKRFWVENFIFWIFVVSLHNLFVFSRFEGAKNKKSSFLNRKTVITALFLCCLTAVPHRTPSIVLFLQRFSPKRQHFGAIETYRWNNHFACYNVIGPPWCPQNPWLAIAATLCPLKSPWWTLEFHRRPKLPQSSHGKVDSCPSISTVALNFHSRPMEKSIVAPGARITFFNFPNVPSSDCEASKTS